LYAHQENGYLKILTPENSILYSNEVNDDKCDEDSRYVSFTPTPKFRIHKNSHEWKQLIAAAGESLAFLNITALC
jgi:hypothetical protein